MKFYKLTQDIEHFSLFLEQPLYKGNYFSINCPFFNFIDISTYKPLEFELYRSDSGKLNYKMDIARFSSTIFIISDITINAFNGLFEKSGTILPIKTKSKRKKFFGFIPNKSFLSDDIINFHQSDWFYGFSFRYFHDIVLNQNAPIDNMLFSFNYSKTIIVNEEFKNIVEKNNLQGFNFSNEIPLIHEDLSQRDYIDQQKRKERELFKINYINEHGEDAYYLQCTPYYLMSEELKKKYREHINEITKKQTPLKK